jgi:hypothetical protein
MPTLRTGRVWASGAAFRVKRVHSLDGMGPDSSEVRHARLRHHILERSQRGLFVMSGCQAPKFAAPSIHAVGIERGTWPVVGFYPGTPERGPLRLCSLEPTLGRRGTLFVPAASSPTLHEPYTRRA